MQKPMGPKIFIPIDAQTTEFFNYKNETIKYNL